MCGIAGTLADPRRGPAALESLRKMAAVLRHRGPDGLGYFRDDRAGLAHTRLSIVDLAGGAQPMANEDRTVWVTFNGEIFNHDVLREELTARGHRFATRSDTEVIVHAFEEWGPAAWRRFNGQFAFGLWDARNRRLWLVRDRFGILPLYYALGDRGVVFASEAKALFASGEVPVRFDPRGVAQAFTFWSVPAPESVFEGVRSVPPGSFVSFDEQLRETAERWWEPRFVPSAEWSERRLDDAADELAHLLRRAVETRLRADVPVGSYLSGGLDSSLIAERAKALAAGELHTFSVRFENEHFDETPEQRRMVAQLKTQHHEILCGDADIRRNLAEVVWRTETPLLRTASVPLFLLSDLVRKSGMKVVVTGEGADELLGGYSIFKEARIRRFWSRRPHSVRRPALLSRIHSYVADAERRGTGMWREFYRRGLEATSDPLYSHRLRWLNTGWGLRFLAPRIRDAMTPGDFDDAVARTMPAGWRRLPLLPRAQALEIATFMSPYLLSSQGDRVAMGHGVEVRYPFLDPDVADFCTSLPDRMKVRGLRDKLALRRLASRSLPEQVWNRPKHPYRAPMTTALFSDADEATLALLSRERLESSGLADADTASRLVAKAARNGGKMAGEREEMALVGVLTLQILHDQFVNDFSARVDESVNRLGAARPDVSVDLSAAGAAYAGSGRAPMETGAP